MRGRGGGNAIDGGAIGIGTVMTASGAASGWSCLPLSMLLAAVVVLASMRLQPRFAGWLRIVLVALLLPGLLLLFRPGLLAAGPVPALFCRAGGTLPLLVLPLLMALGRVPSGQVRAAIGLGAGRAARIRLLWLPQLGPACLAGLLLAGLADAAALTGERYRDTVLSAPARPA